MFNIRFAIEGLHNVFDVLVRERVGIGIFSKQTTGINKLGGGVGFVFGEHQNIHTNGGAKKQVGRERNHGFNVVVIHQVLADFLLGTAPVKNTGEADNGCAA